MHTNVLTPLGWKELTVKPWNKDVCLYCGNPLLDQRFNSALYIGAVCPTCSLKLSKIADPIKVTLPEYLNNENKTPLGKVKSDVFQSTQAD